MLTPMMVLPVAVVGTVTECVALFAVTNVTAVVAAMVAAAALFICVLVAGTAASAGSVVIYIEMCVFSWHLRLGETRFREFGQP